MKKYKVCVDFTASYYTEILAESEEEAKREAYEEGYEVEVGNMKIWESKEEIKSVEDLDGDEE